MKIRQLGIRTNALSPRITLGLVFAALSILPIVSVGSPAWETALESLTDPAKLKDLGERGANSRVNKIIYWLHTAQLDGVSPSNALQSALQAANTPQQVADLTLETQLANCRRARDWGLLAPENLERLRRGQAPTIARGRFRGESTEVDHIVPRSLAPEADNSLANLQLLPAAQNRSKGNRVGWSEVQFAKRLFEARLLNSNSLRAVRWQFFRIHLLPCVGFIAVLGWIWLERRHPGLIGFRRLLRYLLRSGRWSRVDRFLFL